MMLPPWSSSNLVWLRQPTRRRGGGPLGRHSGARPQGREPEIHASRQQELHMRKLLAPVVGSLALMGMTIALSSQHAWSQAARTLRIIISVPPGGSIDLLARILAEHVSSTKGQSIIVESRPGAAGGIAAQAVARAPPG